MKSKRLVRLTLSLFLIGMLICTFNITAFADPESSGAFSWKDEENFSYTATVYRESTYTTREIPISGSEIHLQKNVTHVFGGCTYNVQYTNALWTNTTYKGKLDTAGAQINVKATLNINVRFLNAVTFSSPDVPGTFCAVATGYGYKGNYRVEKHLATDEVLYSGNYSFAPYNCGHQILYITDTRFI